MRLNMDEQLCTIGEAADVLGISIPTLRLYEREGLIITHRRNSRHRRYTQSDLERIRCLRTMINKEKVSVEGIKRLLAMIPCWKMKGCPEEERNSCPAFLQQDKPCWMASGKSWKCKSEECRDCIVYCSSSRCYDLKQIIAAYTTTPDSISAAISPSPTVETVP
ncbi:MAG: MerR family transcriptional regulator [Bacteroidetes bacterium]|nr:MAG: MerR family transcriptional regulator [Bacteroidota bacterium]